VTFKGPFQAKLFYDSFNPVLQTQLHCDMVLQDTLTLAVLMGEDTSQGVLLEVV